MSDNPARQTIPAAGQPVHQSSKTPVDEGEARRSGHAPSRHGLFHRLFRSLAYLWAMPNTLVGLTLTLLALLSGGRTRLHQGVLETHGGIVRFLLRRCTPLPGGAAAITFGHCVLAVDRDTLDWTRRHERVHVRQAERWGPLFIPAYLLASLWATLRRRHFYRDNAFEREAYGTAG
jgi:hypothetical protein